MGCSKGTLYLEKKTEAKGRKGRETDHYFAERSINLRVNTKRLQHSNPKIISAKDNEVPQAPR